LMALRKFLILRKLRSSCLEGRTVLIQPIVNFLTGSCAGVTGEHAEAGFLHRRLRGYRNEWPTITSLG
jgi:hypothetical protein